jgi:hypothetical protein
MNGSAAADYIYGFICSSLGIERVDREVILFPFTSANEIQIRSRVASRDMHSLDRPQHEYSPTPKEVAYVEFNQRHFF